MNEWNEKIELRQAEMHDLWVREWMEESAENASINDWFYSLKVLAHFRPKQLVDFSTYNSQILCLTCAIISEAYHNNKYM